MNVATFDQRIEAIRLRLHDLSRDAAECEQQHPLTASAVEELCSALEDLRRQHEELIARQATEISERKRAEEALRRSEERFRALIEHSADAITLHGADGTVLYASPSASRILGYSGEELNHANPFEFIHPDELESARSLLSELLQNPGKPVTAQYRARHKDGSWRWVETTVTNMLANPSVGAIVSNYRDITERKRAENARQEMTQALLELIDAAPLAIMALDLKGNVAIWNPAAEHVFGWKLVEVLGQPLPIAPEDKRDECRRLLALAQQGIEVADLQTQRWKKSGELIDVSLAMAPLRNTTGDVVGSVRVVADITERKRAEAALRVSQERLQHVIASSPAVIYALAIEGGTFRPMWVSENITQMLGYPAQEALTPDWWHDHIHPEDRARALSDQSLPFPDDHLLREFRFQHKNGTYRWIRDESRLLRDAAGQPVEVIGSWSDITGRKQAEDALRESEKRFEAFMNNTCIQTWMKDEDLHYVYCNEPFERLVGRPREMIIGKNDFDLWPQHTAEELRANDVNVLTRGVLLETHETVPNAEGQIRYSQVFKFPFRDAAGKRYVGGMAVDMTERNQAERALRESEARYRSLVEASPDMIVLTDLDANILMLNPRAVALFGYASAEEIIGRNAFDFIAPEDRPRAAQNLRRTLKTGSVHDIEYTVLKKDGARFPIELSASLLVSPAGEPQAFTAILRDITGRRRAEEKLTRYAAHLQALSRRLVDVQETERRQLAAELHDRVGQNLTALGINLNIIRDQLPRQSAARVKTWLDDSEHLVVQTVEHIRDVMADLRPAVLDDYGLVAALRWYAARFSKRSGVDVTVQSEELAPRLTSGVETALFRITQEALTNVAKHAQARHVRLALEPEADGICLTIADDGVGFDPAAVDRSGERHAWGLTNMRERAETWGGRFGLESAPGQGTRITIGMPR